MGNLMSMEQRLRRVLKKVGTRKGVDPLVSPFDERRITYTDDEGCIERFVVINDDNWSDSEVEDWLYENFAERVSVPWDCSGQWFTAGFHLAHIKGTDEIIVLHYLGLDI